VVTLKLAALSFSGGSSNDTVSIIADGVVAGNASFELGADGIGPSSVVLQSRAGVVDGLQFGGAMTLDAGDGANMRNDILGSNTFVSTPTIVASGGTLVETPAV
jgi:hypothetical protein